MTLDEVYMNLCTKDIRHPDHHDLYDDDDEPPIPRQDCYCNNCFYGRDPLAVYILELLGESTPTQGD